MESFMKKFVASLLMNPDEGNTKKSDYSNFLYNIAVRGDSDHFCKGDIIVPLKSPKVTEVVANNQHSPLHTCVTDPCDKSYVSVTGVLSSVNIPVEKIWIEKNLLCFSLERKIMIQSALKMVLGASQEYGKSRILHARKVIITHDTSQEKTEPADIYRGHVILKHVVKKLKFAGAEVQTRHCVESDLKDICTQSNECEVREKSESIEADIKEKSAIECTVPKEVNSVMEDDQIRLCLRCSGKSMAVNSTQWGRVLKYKHLINTETGKAWRVSAEELLKILLNELKTAMELKYGDVSSEKGSQFLCEQAVQCMTLQLLSKNYSDNLRVDVAGDTQNTKDWAFVLYNYARLKMIFKSFEAQVSDGCLPPLPSTEDVDFSLLKCEEEWVLVWEYIIRWPEMVEEFATAVLKDPSKIKTSALAKFLHTLSHRFSVYYRRFRVLVSGDFPHLMPLMYARLYLLKSLLIVMDICFDLMGVDSPPECM